jgi:hypothetical protein
MTSRRKLHTKGHAGCRRRCRRSSSSSSSSNVLATVQTSLMRVSTWTCAAAC